MDKQARSTHLRECLRQEVIRNAESLSEITP